MEKRFVTFSLVALLVFLHIPDVHSQTPEVPEYEVTWRAYRSNDSAMVYDTLCGSITCIQTGSGLYEGKAVIGTKGNYMSGSTRVDYSIINENSDISNIIEGTNCRAATSNCNGSLLFSGNKNIPLQSTFLREALNNENRYILWGDLSIGWVEIHGYSRCVSWDSVSGESITENSSESTSWVGWWHDYFGDAGVGWTTIPSTDPVGMIFEKSVQLDLSYDLTRLFCSTVPPTTLTVTIKKLFDPLVLHAIEVTQAIQDWDNSVPLVEGKDTYVRAFITPRPEEPATNIPVYAQLRGYRALEDGRVIQLKDSPLYTPK